MQFLVPAYMLQKCSVQLASKIVMLCKFFSTGCRLISDFPFFTQSNYNIAEEQRIFFYVGKRMRKMFHVSSSNELSACV